MATSISTITTSWTSILVGPQTSVAIQPQNASVLYQIATVLPTANEGHIIHTGQGHTIGLDTGENLYAKAESNYATKLAVTV